MGITPTIDILPVQRKTLLSLLRRFIPGVEVWAYGSRVKWTARPNSDLDLVAFTTPEQRPLISELKEALDESNIPFFVDLHVWGEIPERFHEIIRKEYVVLVERGEVGVGVNSNLPEYPLGELMEITSSKRIFMSDYNEDGVPFYRSKEIIERAAGKSISTDLYITRDKYEEIKRKFSAPIEGDILLTSVGTLGISYQVQANDEFYFKDGNLTWFRNFSDKINSRFLLYWLRSPIARRAFEMVAIGSTQKALTIDSLKKIKINLPDILTQLNIVNVLDSLEGKLNVNRQIKQTLEQIAQAIFKSWFVNFDPVKAKIQAKEQGCDPERAAMSAISGKSENELGMLSPEQYQQIAATAALFPDELEESELGLIPKGWEVGALSDLCNLNEHSWTNKSLPQDVWYVDLANTKDGVINEVQRFSNREIPSRARRILKPGDTVVGTVRPGNRSFALIGNYGRQITGSTGFAVLTPKTPEMREFVYLISTSESNIERLAHLADGGAYPAVRPEIIIRQSLVQPLSNVIKAFHSVVSPLYNDLLLHLENNKQLATLRDTLLPKLLSGELRVKAKLDLADMTGKAGRSDKRLVKRKTP